MNRDKQIEEMTEDLCAIECKGMKCNNCDHYGCEYRMTAEALYTKGYRKASDVARKTVEAIKKEVSKKEQFMGDLYGYGGFVIAITDLEDIIRIYMFDTYEESELKKKYTEGEG